MAVDPHEDSVEAGGDEAEGEDVPARVWTLVRRIPEADGPSFLAPLVGNRFCGITNVFVSLLGLFQSLFVNAWSKDQ